jgi:hypothetical protein
VRADRDASTADFVDLVWPALQTYCRDLQRGDLFIVEGGSDPLHFDLDVRAGIDGLQRGAYALRGLASRVQWGKDYQTFTVRLARPNGSTTEFEKRQEVLNHLDQGYLYPFWTIQAYVSRPGGRLYSVGVAKTVELYRYIAQRAQEGPPLQQQHAGKGGETFLIIPWEEYLAAGYYLFRYVSPTSSGREMQRS